MTLDATTRRVSALMLALLLAPAASAQSGSTGQRAVAFPAPNPIPVTPPIEVVDVAASVGLGGTYDPQGDGHCPGVVFTDLDGDHLPDLYLPRGDTRDVVPMPQTNLLFLNDGNGGFNAVADADGADDDGNSAGALAADFTGDGLRDLFVINMEAGNTFYVRTAGGRFEDRTDDTDPSPDDGAGDDQEGLGVACNTGETAATGCTLDASLAAAAGDFDRDGWLDLYVGNHQCCANNGGQRDVLYLNDGLGAGPNSTVTFTDITVDAGIEVAAPDEDSSTQAVLVVDVNNDRWPDIYVSHKSDGPAGNRDHLFLNDGDSDGDGLWKGTFSEYFIGQPIALGSVTCQAMGIDAADYDNDGDFDIYLSDISNAGCADPSVPLTDMDLYRNLWIEQTNTTGAFDLEIVDPNPAPAPDFAWGVSWGDFDNDCDEDLHVSTAIDRQNYLYRNDRGDNPGFADVTVNAGAALVLNSRASVPADYDRDGRLDLLMAHRDPLPVTLFRNQTRRTHHWLEVRLVGNPATGGLYQSTPEAIGAVVEVIAGAKTQRRDIRAGGHSCASTRDHVAHFGVGQNTLVNVKVFWPSGQSTRLPDQTVDRVLVVTEP